MARKGFERPERIQFNDDGYQLDTLAVRAGQHRSEEGEHSDAIYPTRALSTARHVKLRRPLVVMKRGISTRSSLIQRFKRLSVVLQH